METPGEVAGGVRPRSPPAHGGKRKPHPRRIPLLLLQGCSRGKPCGKVSRTRKGVHTPTWISGSLLRRYYTRPFPSLSNPGTVFHFCAFTGPGGPQQRSDGFRGNRERWRSVPETTPWHPPHDLKDETPFPDGLVGSRGWKGTVSVPALQISRGREKATVTSLCPHRKRDSLI